jgi:hypothetical protein
LRGATDEVGGVEEPGGEVADGGEAGGVAGEEIEDGLGGLVGEDGIAELAEAGGVDEGGVAGDERGNGVGGVGGGELLEELGVVHRARVRELGAVEVVTS